MKNRYGSLLRAFIGSEYHLDCYVDMVNTDAFHEDVSAYPAIFVIRRGGSGATRVAQRPSLDSTYLAGLASALRGEIAIHENVRELASIIHGEEPWIVDSTDQIDIVRRLEAKFSPIEDAGCEIGIGVATGADRVFIAPLQELNVELDRKLPLVTTKDIQSGVVQWKGLGVINPFKDDGSLVELERYPLLKSYLDRHRDLIENRNCARRNPDQWYRTIDRIRPHLRNKPKLLIPDIKGKAHVVYEAGGLYPHHNLYYVISQEWDLHALQAVLLSNVTRLFISVYSTQMRGGYLRFQAQYLRRIRLPMWKSVSESVRSRLIAAAYSGDRKLCDEAVCDLYALTPEERASLGGRDKKEQS